MSNEKTLTQNILDLIGFFLVVIGYTISGLVKLCIPNSWRTKKNVQGEVVLITGGGGGLGRLLALRLARLKAVIVIWDVNEKAIEETVKLVDGVGGKAFGYKCDLCDRNDVYKVAKKTVEEAGDVTILINNAGIVVGELLLNTPDEMIQRTFEVNTISHFWTTKAFLPKMIEKDHGHIVTIASMAGLMGMRKLVDYCASKYAAIGFDEALRIELEQEGTKGIKTTVICPYFIQQTGMFVDVTSRFVPRLKPNDVADRIVEAIEYEELTVMIPTAFRYLYFLKWLFPWSVVSLLLRSMVPDAHPDNGDQVKEKHETTLENKHGERDAENNLKQRLVKERAP